MPTEKPNILFIVADDMGWGDVGFHGSAIRTPTLDRLAATGRELDQHYVCPVCTPTRAALLSGRAPGRFGPHATTPSNAPVFPDGYGTLPAVLRDGGYATGLFGKWHLGSRPEFGPNRFGFDTAYGSLAGGVDPYNHRYKSGRFSVTWHRNGEFVEDTGHVTDLIADEAVRWIERQRGPWFCYVPFTAVHFPVKAPQDWLDRYAGTQYDPDPERDLSFRTYAAYASHMDAAIGRLVETLERRCIRDNTLIVFTSDNGAVPGVAATSTAKYPGFQPASPRLGSNLPWRGQKSQLYEGGVRTPTLVNWAGRIGPGRMSRPVQAADWMPTLCGLTGCRPAVDPHWDGVDIWPLLDPQAGRPAPVVEERPIYWNLRGNQFAVRQGPWKLIVREKPGAAPVELFDMATDARETTDLSAREPETVARLREVIAAQRKRDGVSARPDVSSPEVDNPETEP
ncbi:MAG: sulfatase-like hydrolase/transferase [Opitutaceae bacterium]|nr:sulfatase-like hydrolase/transferase [Opitutaceae bacterium]